MKKILLGALLGMMVLLLVAAAPDDTTIFGAGGNSEFLLWTRMHNSSFDTGECIRVDHNNNPSTCGSAAVNQLVVPAPGTVTRISASLQEVMATDIGCIFTWRKNGTTSIGSFSAVEIAVDATDVTAAGDTFYANVSTHLDEGDYIDIALSAETDHTKCTGTCLCAANNSNITVNTWFKFD